MKNTIYLLRVEKLKRHVLYSLFRVQHLNEPAMAKGALMYLHNAALQYRLKVPIAAN